MTPFSDAREEALLSLLAKGPAKAADLADALHVSQPTLSRLVQSLGAQIVKLGAGRTTRYSRPRRIGDDWRWPLYRVTQDATIESCGEVMALMGVPAFRFSAPWADLEYADGLPFFLQDQRPQGFMGKHVPAAVPGLGLPPRIQDWMDDHVLRYLAAHGHDAVGDLILGAESLQRWQAARAEDHAARSLIALERRTETFERLAEEAIGGVPTGSSAGGEQPKFSANVDSSGWTLVKFSPPGASEASLRWRDLLLAEWHALDVLNEHGIPAARAELIDGPVRRFLQVARFDRHAEYGRSSLMSMGALNNEFVGIVDNWTRTAAALAQHKLIATQDVEHIGLIETFAVLIGNSDRHNGNLSFAATYAPSPPFALAPCYDMLPMHYAPPSSAEVRPYAPLALRAPGAEGPDVWLRAADMAAAFWERIAADTRATQPFRAVADENAAGIRPHRDTALRSWNIATPH